MPRTAVDAEPAPAPDERGAPAGARTARARSSAPSGRAQTARRSNPGPASTRRSHGPRCSTRNQWSAGGAVPSSRSPAASAASAHRRPDAAEIGVVTSARRARDTLAQQPAHQHVLVGLLHLRQATHWDGVPAQQRAHGRCGERRQADLPVRQLQHHLLARLPQAVVQPDAQAHDVAVREPSGERRPRHHTDGFGPPAGPHAAYPPGHGLVRHPAQASASAARTASRCGAALPGRPRRCPAAASRSAGSSASSAVSASTSRTG